MQLKVIIKVKITYRWIVYVSVYYGSVRIYELENLSFLTFSSAPLCSLLYLLTIPVSVLEACHMIDVVPVGCENIAGEMIPLPHFFLWSGSQENQQLPLLQLYACLWCIAPDMVMLCGTVISHVKYPESTWVPHLTMPYPLPTRRQSIPLLVAAIFMTPWWCFLAYCILRCIIFSQLKCCSLGWCWPSTKWGAEHASASHFHLFSGHHFYLFSVIGITGSLTNREPLIICWLKWN